MRPQTGCGRPWTTSRSYGVDRLVRAGVADDVAIDDVEIAIDADSTSVVPVLTDGVSTAARS
ncbi:hypothetical protein [Streptomyces sp. ALI-76-A]|uniref:hypothetical protein n=1 Tax=Streptomyces sp. ALI-76-A TaxID=3025736 RepID=UPI00256F5D61|nr:hypothetical protein [Streptomyces sp. ALI-76-A]MDL5205440.1 hypothetical protein [Streptomyces sp. ALI-76-A]